jgi:hypothetical protein
MLRNCPNSGTLLDLGDSPSMPAAPTPQHAYAAIMGDIVSSQDALDVGRLYDTFNGAVNALNAGWGNRLSSPLTITLGDEFQGLGHSLADGLSIVQTLRRRLLLAHVDCRFVLGVVALHTPLNTERAWNMMGPGLAETRERLADKRDPNAYRFFLPGEPTIQNLLDAVGASLTSIERGWTDRQAEIVARSFDNTTGHKDLAGELQMSLRTLYKIRSAAQLDLYLSHWKVMETTIAEMDERYGLA